MTGVQTCALPICVLESGGAVAANGDDGDFHGGGCREKAGVPPFPAEKGLQAEFGEHVGCLLYTSTRM